MAEGIKFDEGKPRWDLFPPSLVEVAKVFSMGADKYGDRNWENGIVWHRIFRALIGHAWKWWWGERNDPEDGQHHLSSVAWCALVLMHYETTHPELDDRPELAQVQVKPGRILRMPQGPLKGV